MAWPSLSRPSRHTSQVSLVQRHCLTAVTVTSMGRRVNHLVCDLSPQTPPKEAKVFTLSRLLDHTKSNYMPRPTNVRLVDRVTLGNNRRSVRRIQL